MSETEDDIQPAPKQIEPAPRPLLTSTPDKLHPRLCKGNHDRDLPPPDCSHLSSLVDEEYSREYSFVADHNASYAIQWQLTNVINFNGCEEKCAIMIHGLTTHDILRAHYFFENKSQTTG